MEARSLIPILIPPGSAPTDQYKPTIPKRMVALRSEANQSESEELMAFALGSPQNSFIWGRMGPP
jgi:hypothetical protein